MRAPEKGGDLACLALSAKVAHEVAHRAVTEPKPLGDLSHGSTLDEEGAQDFIAALKDGLRLEEELLAKQVVHDLTSESVIEFIPHQPEDRNGAGGEQTRPSGG